MTVLMVLVVTISACSRKGAATPESNSATAVPTTAQPVGWQCDLTVEGNSISLPNGRQVVLHGANLPTLTAMEGSGYKWEARLSDLANMNARVVRLAVSVKELTPTFVPAKVVPFVREANNRGMIVILSWDAIITDPIDAMVDDAEDWVRLEIDYLNNNTGVWFDVYDGMKDVPITRQKSIAQRLVDVARGYRSKNVILVNNPAWLFEPSGEVNTLLNGSNIVYGLNTGAVSTLTLNINNVGDEAPFMITRWGNATSPLSVDVEYLKKIGIGTLAAGDLVDSPNMPLYLADWWKLKAVKWESCKK